MQAINTRGTFVVSRACILHLKRSANPHILTLSPPVSLEPRWLGPHIGYTTAKYGMTLCALGLAAELRLRPHDPGPRSGSARAGAARRPS
jgi:citronellol/citronellal dehydrogenase